jgi:hypothetical protein
MKHLIPILLCLLVSCSNPDEIRLVSVKSEPLDDVLSKCMMDAKHTINFFHFAYADTTKTNQIYFDSPFQHLDKNNHHVDLYIEAVCESKFNAQLSQKDDSVLISLKEYFESGCDHVIHVALDITGNLKNKKLYLREIESANGRLTRYGKLKQA